MAFWRFSLTDFGSDFWQGFWPDLLGPENTMYSSTGTEKYREIECAVLPGKTKQTIYYLLFEMQKVQNSMLDNL